MGGRGSRVDVNREVKFFVKIQKNNIFFFWGGEVRSGGRGVFGVGGHRVDVNKELKFFVKIKKKLGGMGGQGRCNREVKFL